MRETQPTSVFKWSGLCAAIVFACLLLWMIADFKRKMVTALDKAEATVNKVQQSVEKVDERMPIVLAEIQNTSRTLSRVADDVELIKRVAGINNENEDRGFRSLAIYADDLQSFLAVETEGKQVQILVKELIGNDLKVVESAAEFLVGVNKEMVVVVLPLAKSREEILYRICHSGVRRQAYFIKFADEEPVELEGFIRERHPASHDLPVFNPDR